MKNKSLETTTSEKAVNLKPLSKNQLETIIGGPETTRGTRTELP